MTRKLAIVVIGCALLAAACGGSPAVEEPDPAAAEDTNAGTSADPSPTSTYAFADQPYNEVSRGACTGFEEVGEKDRIALDIRRPKSGVGEFFYPNCLTNVKGNSLTVELTNNGMTHHNFIVEGDDIELVVAPGKSGTIDVELGPAEEIGFQCTIHERFMFGAFFRKNA